MARARLTLMIGGLLVVASPVLRADEPPPPPADTSPPAAPAPVAAAPAAASPPASSQPGAPAAPSATPAPSAPAKEEPKPTPKVPMTGYGWTDDEKPRAKPHAPARPHPRPAPRPTGPTVVRPGFEMLADGASRLFVELSQTVTIEEKRGAHDVSYVLKGTRIDRTNNYNPLVTTHFNTPVTRARLVAHGKDLWFSVELRAAVTPTWKLTPAKDGMQILQVELPKGDYLQADPEKDGQKKVKPTGSPSTDTPASKDGDEAPPGG